MRDRVEVFRQRNVHRLEAAPIRVAQAFDMVSDSGTTMITISKAFEEVLFLNHDHEYSYTREQLIALMDAQQAFLNSGTKPELDPED